MSQQYVCADCGSLLIHTNPVTLGSMKEVHEQLCVMKREKLISAQSIKDIPSTMVQTNTVSTVTESPRSGIAMESQQLGETSISLTGSGTDYSKVEGPIDTSFKSSRQKTGKFKGISVWGPVDAPGQLGIWGDSVCVDFDICIGDGACIEACPVNVYEWLETPGHPGSDKKPIMAREKDCIFCLACENVCPPQAIKIYQKQTG
ncbi:MAG: ferredoxin family protein [Nitrososphaeraceae archaeon]|nr:ferredoxin family protein [Nitrososphaeraceae archaeon]